MNPKVISPILALSLLGLAGCGDTSSSSGGYSEDQIYELETQVEDLEAQVADLESKISDIESEFDNVTSSVRKLGYEIDDFGTENWQDNVSEVEYEFRRLKRAVNDVEYEF